MKFVYKCCRCKQIFKLNLDLVSIDHRNRFMNIVINDNKQGINKYCLDCIKLKEVKNEIARQIL
ncbi:MAG: hypothetical protein ACRCX2_19480 [Paraclostridium sp.]